MRRCVSRTIRSDRHALFPTLMPLPNQPVSIPVDLLQSSSNARRADGVWSLVGWKFKLGVWLTPMVGGMGHSMALPNLYHIDQGNTMFFLAHKPCPRKIPALVTLS